MIPISKKHLNAAACLLLVVLTACGQQQTESVTPTDTVSVTAPTEQAQAQNERSLLLTEEAFFVRKNNLPHITVPHNFHET